MTNQLLYEAIFRRKSIRKYDMTPLPATTIDELQNFISKLKPLDTTIKFEFHFLGTNDVKNILPIKAPHYICLYSEAKGNYLPNAGFLVQQIDLYLSANNLGSCWLGMAKPTKLVPQQQNGLGFVILLAFGNTSEPIHRNDTSAFKRNNMADIADMADKSQIPSADEVLEPVRLAPSASNSQPWFFTGSPDEMVVSRKKLSLVRAPLYGRMNQIDIGIALCHLWLSLDHHGKSAIFDFHKVDVPDGYEFMAKVMVGK